ncbi:RIP-like protein [Scaptodrosophila lebanonensis]|uniref:RIP-like protein n=1 Tax=Drosophila lebanonensis TaxID=7225 RepID=A0A6J2TPG5_DROLE|nr:RIP-like protein [Scaptodrosophila lebanonensis]
MECPRSPVFHTSVEQKRHAQNVARKQRMGSTKLRELLREKCRIRVLNARRECLDQSRSLHLSEFNDLLLLELKELQLDIELDEKVREELLAEMNEWHALEMQELENMYAEETDEDTTTVICPVCLKKPLQRLPPASYKCECGVRFEHAADIQKLRRLLQEKIDAHELSCTQALRFFIEPVMNEMSLAAMCGSCDYMCTI